MTLSIRVRLTLWYLAVLAISLVLLEGLIYVSVRGSIARMTDSDLQERLLATSDFLTEHIKTDPPSELQDEFEEYSASRPGGELLQVRDDSGAWVFQSASWQRYSIPSRAAGSSEASRVFSDWQAGHTSLRILAGEKRIGSKRYFIQIATDTTQSALTLEKLRLLLLVFTPLALGLAITGGYWLSGQALTPVKRISRAAQAINPDRLNQRLDVPTTADELQLLAETLNEMLARIESGVKSAMQFTADASHELRTPITNIRAGAEIALRREREPHAYREALQDILCEAARTTDLIDDLLTLARLDSKQALPTTPVDLNKAVQTAILRVRPVADHKQISISLDARHEFWIEGNEEALTRLFFILFDNAVKYTPQGGAVQAAIAKDLAVTTVKVQDSGIGVSSGDLPHIFDRFYRADKVRSRGEGGVGLGLAIAKSIAETHGANLTAASTETQGSCFRVIFTNSQPVASPTR